MLTVFAKTSREARSQHQRRQTRFDAWSLVNSCIRSISRRSPMPRERQIKSWKSHRSIQDLISFKRVRARPGVAGEVVGSIPTRSTNHP